MPRAGETGQTGAEGVKAPQTLRQKDPRDWALWREGPLARASPKVYAALRKGAANFSGKKDRGAHEPGTVVRRYRVRAPTRHRGGCVDIPEKLKYTASHEWIADHGDGTVTVGITAVASEQLGELVYVELPKPGTQVKQAAACAVVESTKAASDVYAPLSGEVIAVNGALAAAPGQVNTAPYSEGWLYKLRLANPGELAALLDAPAYRASAGVP